MRKTKLVPHNRNIPEPRAANARKREDAEAPRARMCPCCTSVHPLRRNTVDGDRTRSSRLDGLEISQLRFAVPDRIALGGGWSQSRLRRAATISLQRAEARGKTNSYSDKCTRKCAPGRLPQLWFNGQFAAHQCNPLKIPRSVAEVNGKASQAQGNRTWRHSEPNRIPLPLR
jgi:hypothetical protein